MRSNSGAVLGDVLKGSVLTLSLYLAYITLPLVGMVAGFVTPLPALVYALVGGPLRGALIVAVTSVGVWAYAGPAAMVMYLAQAGVMALALSFFLGKSRPLSHAILGSTAVCACFAVAVAAGYSLFSGVNLHEEIVKGIGTSIRQVIDLYGKNGVTGDDLAAMRQILEQVGQMLSASYPALLTVLLGAVAGVNILLIRKFGSRWGVVLNDADFTLFSLPEPLVWLVIAAGFSLFIRDEVTKFVAINLLVVLSSLYFMQGMAVVVSFFRRFAVPTIVRAIFYVLVGVQPYLMLVMAFLGLFDIWGNFRVPRQKNL
jgi:uncharacterized protein YybS (DUF2232 family)